MKGQNMEMQWSKHDKWQALGILATSQEPEKVVLVRNDKRQSAFEWLVDHIELTWKDRVGIPGTLEDAEQLAIKIAMKQDISGMTEAINFIAKEHLVERNPDRIEAMDRVMETIQDEIWRQLNVE